MSPYTLFLKSIFFLAITFGMLNPNIIIAQSSKNINSATQERIQFLGEILFVANINGVIENCNCGYPPLGGLPQICTIINRRISENPHSYFIDGGDFLNTYPFPLLNIAVVDIYKSMNIIYLALGDQEWIDTDELDQKVMTDLKDKIIASNFIISNNQFNKFGTIKLADGTSAKIISYLDEKAFYVSDDKKLIDFDNEQFISIYNKISIETDLIILIFHGTNYTLEWIKKKFPKINLILYAHEQSNIKIISEQPAIVGGGADGEYIKDIRIYREANEYHFKINAIPVSSDLESNLEILEIVNQFKVADKIEKGDL